MPSRLTQAQLKRKFNELRLSWRWIGPSGIVRSWLGSKPGLRRQIEGDALGSGAPFWVRLPSTDVNVLRQWFDPAHPTFAVNPDVKVVVDCGANIGVSTRIFAECFPSARVIAIELAPDNVEMLLQNTEAYPSIEVLHAGVWDKECQLFVQPTTGDEWDYQAIERSKDSSCLEDTVPAVTIDGILEKFNLDRIDLLKLDIEGSESRVLANPERWIDRVDTIMVELHERFAPGCTEVYEQAVAQYTTKWDLGELVCASRAEAIVQPEGICNRPRRGQRVA